MPIPALTTRTVKFQEYKAVIYDFEWDSFSPEKKFHGYKGTSDIINGNIFSQNLFEINKNIYTGDSKYLPKEIENKWVYVFRTTNYTNIDGTNILVNPINVNNSNKTYQLPIFENYNGINKPVYSFFCLSQIQLSSTRVKQLREQLDSFLKSLKSFVLITRYSCP